MKESLETVQRAIRVAFTSASNSASTEQEEEERERGLEPASDDRQTAEEETGTPRSSKTKKPTRYQECTHIVKPSFSKSEMNRF